MVPHSEHSTTQQAKTWKKAEFRVSLGYTVSSCFKDKQAWRVRCESMHLFLKIYFFLFYECFACMYVHLSCACCPWRPEDGIGAPGTGVMNCCVGTGN